ncbi:MAG: exo-alpha-sialidase, partial [Lentisphaeria bacterium]|nr:exo-alpha-sialidase [Lentisphaeria bacterium]
MEKNANPRAAKEVEMKILEAGLVYPLENRPTPQCHASTLEALGDGRLVAAWFGGEREKADDVGIWVSSYARGVWSRPREVADGVQAEPPPGQPARYPCWNPVLFRYPGGPLLLFYKVGPSPGTWWGEWLRSLDDGATWQEMGRLPEGILGPIKNKPVLTAGGRLLCPSSTEDNGWRLHFEWTDDGGATWGRSEAIHDGREIGAIQPTILTLADGRLMALARTRNTG